MRAAENFVSAIKALCSLVSGKGIRARAWLPAVMFLLLTACQDYGCVEADDWGYPKIPILMDFEDLKNDGQLVFYPGNDYAQYLNPVDSHQLLMGTPLVIKMDRSHNQWAPFLGPWLNPIFDGDGEERMVDGWWPENLIPNRECRYFNYDPDLKYNHLDKLYFDPNFSNRQPTIALQKQQLTDCVRDEDSASDFTDADFYGDCLAPCFVRHGVGLYVAAYPDKKTLQDTPSLALADLHITHLTDFDLNGPLNANPDGTDPRNLDKFLVANNIPGTKKNDRLYFTIEDSYYQDNAGGYVVHLKCGTKPDKKGPFQYITDMVKTFSLSMAEAMYKILVSSENFVNITRALLALSVVLYGLSFLMGTVAYPLRLGDFVIYVLKIGAVVALISPNSWNVFYNHFFVFFTSGIDYLGGLFLEGVKDLGLGCNWLGEESPWYAADVMFRVLTSDETWRKVASTLFSNIGVGWAFIIAFIAGFIIFFIAAAKMLLMYAVGFISLSMLIILFPIFFVLYLFGWTKDYFHTEWVGQAIANVTEIVFSVALLGFIFQLIMMMLQGTLGYRVCWRTIFEFPKSPVLVSLEFFMPDIQPVIASTDTDGDGALDAMRYIDMPYFDLDKDKDKIERYLRQKNFLDFSGVIGFLAIMLIFRYMSDLLNKISDDLKSGGENFRQSASIATSGASPSTILNDAKQTLPVQRKYMLGVIPRPSIRPGGAFVSTAKRIAATSSMLGLNKTFSKAAEGARKGRSSFLESTFLEKAMTREKLQGLVERLENDRNSSPEEIFEARKKLLENNQDMLRDGLKYAEKVLQKRAPAGSDEGIWRRFNKSRSGRYITDADYNDAAGDFAAAVKNLEARKNLGADGLQEDVEWLNESAERLYNANRRYERRTV